MKKLVLLAVTLVLILSQGLTQVSAEALSDIQNHWAKKQITVLVDQGVISGFEDGTFRPNADVTRGQFAAFLVRALDLPPGDSAFNDVPESSKLYPDVSAAKKAGLLLGTVDGYGLVNEPVTRANVAVMIDRALQLKGNFPEKANLTFTDQGSIPAYARESIERMVNYGVVLGTSDNRIDHSSPASRAESAVFVYRMLVLLGEIIDDNPNPPTDPPAPIKEPGKSVNLSSSEIQIPLGDGNKVRVRMNTAGVPLHYNRSDVFTHIKSKDYNYYYHMGNSSKPLGTMRVTLRRVDNGDTFVFTKFEHNGDNTYSASIILPFDEASSYKVQRYDAYGKVVHEHNDTYGIDPSTHPIGILNVANGSQTRANVMMSKNYTSIKREKAYPNSQKSVVREFLDEYESYKIYQDTTSKAISMQLNMKVTGKAISESWVLLSNQKLFEDQSYIDYWFKRSIDEYHTINKWLTADGVYTKLPWSVEPGYKMAFGRNLGYIQGGIYLRAYNGSNERYFYNLVMNSIADLDVFTNGAIRNGDVPVFKTEYTSTWLKKAYGTTAPYIDTRHNENTALFLKGAGEAFNIQQLADANRKYADFLVNQKDIGNIIKITHSSHLIADYYAPGSQTTHVSLNHALGEMRFLIETYQQTKNEKYYRTAREIKTAIEYLYPRWVRDDGDLWYQVNGKLEFNGRDYAWLTLVDLLKSQTLFEEIGQARSSIFDKMITSKTKYLVNTGQPIKSNIIDMLKDQGFGDLVKNYGSVSSASGLEKDELELLAEEELSDQALKLLEKRNLDLLEEESLELEE
ncbi:S-layer homology domain-containing protein [Cytobacillus sp.]|uniref:S-layer homology domain-containing protein n=1 Tax=Cytobacillus sp. TaxID=2675269 RepID=UPI003516E399